MLPITKHRICIKHVHKVHHTVGVASCLTTVQYDKITNNSLSLVIDNIIVTRPIQNSMGTIHPHAALSGPCNYK